MYLRSRLLVSIFILSGALHGCVAGPDKDDSRSGLEAPTKESLVVSDPNLPLSGNGPGCEQIITSLETGSYTVPKEALLTLVADAKRDTPSRDLIFACLINELRQLCNAEYSEDGTYALDKNFYKIKNVGEASAELKISDAIPILVDCSERRLIFGGLSSHNYPAIDPLLHFGDDAIPTLMKKYHDVDSLNKCRIASIINGIPGPRASQSLRKLLETERDPKIRKCLTICLRSHSNAVPAVP